MEYLTNFVITHNILTEHRIFRNESNVRWNAIINAFVMKKTSFNTKNMIILSKWCLIICN